jgi:hypothetical protein
MGIMGSERRSMHDRRSGKDRRSLGVLKHFFLKTRARGDHKERRQTLERRRGWVRLSKWSSVHLRSLKISKFLKTREPKGPPDCF